MGKTRWESGKNEKERGSKGREKDESEGNLEDGSEGRGKKASNVCI